MPQPISLVYFGTPEISVPALDALVQDERFEVRAVVTQPPRPAGRHAKEHPSAVHRFAEERKIPVLTPDRTKEIGEELKTINADVHVVVSFGQILPKSIVFMPPHGTVNIHPSLLPKHRGAAPVPATILAGDAMTGVTIMLMDEKMDHGAILDVSEHPVDGKTTAILLPELMRIGANRLPNVLDQLTRGELKPIEQDHNNATYSNMLSRDDARIDWSQPTKYVERMIRAYDPWPGTWTEIETDKGWRRLKILSAHVDTSRTGNRLETIDKMTHIGSLVIDRLQLEGKKPLSGAEFTKTRPGLSWRVR